MVKNHNLLGTLGKIDKGFYRYRIRQLAACEAEVIIVCCASMPEMKIDLRVSL